MSRTAAISSQEALGARPYNLCRALTHDLLSPARALITISIWPLVVVKLRTTADIDPELFTTWIQQVN